MLFVDVQYGQIAEAIAFNLVEQPTMCLLENGKLKPRERRTQ
jgi:hypothetical protein